MVVLGFFVGIWLVYEFYYVIIFLVKGDVLFIVNDVEGIVLFDMGLCNGLVSGFFVYLICLYGY